MQTEKFDCDIILFACGRLTNLNETVCSILKSRNNGSYRLFIAYDDLDSYTEKYLEDFSCDNLKINLVRSDREKMSRVVNKLVLESKARFFALVTKNILVADFWLDRMIFYGMSEAGPGIVQPVSSSYFGRKFKMPSGTDFISINYYLANISPKSTFSTPLTDPSFLFFRRDFFIQAGMLDTGLENYYSSLQDFSMKLFSKGSKTVVAPDVYVHHLESDNRELFFKNGTKKKKDQLFNRKLQKKFRSPKKKEDHFDSDPIKKIVDLFNGRKRWAPEPCLRQTYRQVRTRFQKQAYLGAIFELIHGFKSLFFSFQDVISPEMVKRFAERGKIQVTYVLPALTIAGGVLSVIQLVNELIMLGVQARVAALRIYPEIYEWRLLFEPMIFKNRDDLVKNFPKSDIAVATHFSTVPWVQKAVETGQAEKSFYFIQDYESWFFPESDIRSRNLVKKSYDLMPHKVVKSDWLKNLLANDGYPSEKIRLGMDLLTFYPRDAGSAKGNVLIAMARPRTPRRGFSTLIKALEKVKKLKPDTKIIFFGDNLKSYSIPFDFIDYGVISDQDQLAMLYSKANIFIDSSDFQGFGRTALEAMACGTACILTDTGGVLEYAKNMHNCVLVPPKEPDRIADGILKVLNNHELRSRITANGLITVRDFCHKREARQTFDYIKRLLYNVNEL